MDAEALASEHGCVLEGEGMGLTGDARLDRVDVYVDDGRIVGVTPS